jgi:hypothetical protein
MKVLMNEFIGIKIEWEMLWFKILNDIQVY